MVSLRVVGYSQWLVITQTSGFTRPCGRRCSNAFDFPTSATTRSSCAGRRTCCSATGNTTAATSPPTPRHSAGGASAARASLPLPSRQPDEHWASMERVFHLDRPATPTNDPTRTTMLTVICETPGVLIAEQQPRPARADGEVLLRVKRAGVCGTDLHLHRRPALSQARRASRRRVCRVPERARAIRSQGRGRQAGPGRDGGVSVDRCAPGASGRSAWRRSSSRACAARP